jgi:hypothetical protein
MLRMISGLEREAITLPGKNCMRNFMICTHHHRALRGSNQGNEACTGEKRNVCTLLAEKPGQTTLKNYAHKVG